MLARVQSFHRTLKGDSDPLVVRTTSPHRNNLCYYFGLYSSILFNAHTHTYIQTRTQIFITIFYIMSNIIITLFRYHKYCLISFNSKNMFLMAALYSTTIDILDYFHWFPFVGCLEYLYFAVISKPFIDFYSYKYLYMSFLNSLA